MKNQPRVSNLLKLLLISAAVGLTACGGGGGGGTVVLLGATSGTVIIGDGSGQLSIQVFAAPNPPPATVGADGDYFLDVTTGKVYGPKAGGVWPAASISLQGPPGLQDLLALLVRPAAVGVRPAARVRHPTAWETTATSIST